MNNVSYLAEKLSHLVTLYHHQVFPFSKEAEKLLVQRIERMTKRFEEALLDEARRAGVTQPERPKP